jgi:flavin reductase (DIM6/NTAB) family NADH-FMN oxidoreductase RutF
VTPELRLIAGTGPSSRAEFVEAMSALASGVAIVTCRTGDRPWGMTITSFVSVSADPPTVLVSLGVETPGARAIAATRRFGVSILAEEQVVVARYGSVKGATKFLEPFTGSAAEESGSPVVDGALAHLDCEVVDDVRVADHTVFFGRVRAARALHPGNPLVYMRRDYRTLSGPDSLRRTAGVDL